MLLPSPLVWEHYFIWLLPVFVYCISRSVTRWAALLFGVLFILLALPLPIFGRMLGLVSLLPLWILVGVLMVRSAGVPLRKMIPNTVHNRTKTY
jgi:O-antigen ligase